MKVLKSVVGAIQVGPNPRHACLTEGVCLVALVNTAVQQIRDGALSPMPFCLGIGGIPVGPGMDTHSALGLEAGRLWVARLDQTADTRQTW